MFCSEKTTSLDPEDFQRFWKQLYERDYSNIRKPENYRRVYQYASSIFHRYAFGKALNEAFKYGWEKPIFSKEGQDYLRDLSRTSYEFTYRIPEKAGEGNHPDLIDYVLSLKGLDKQKLLLGATKGGHLDLIRQLVTSAGLDQDIVNAAIATGDPDIIDLFLEIAPVRLILNTFDVAAENDDRETPINPSRSRQRWASRSL